MTSACFDILLLIHYFCGFGWYTQDIHVEVNLWGVYSLHSLYKFWGSNSRIRALSMKPPRRLL